MKKFLLKQRVLPAVLFYVLLPRSVFHLPNVLAFVFLVIFSAILIFYMVVRYTIVKELVDKKSVIILDCGCAVVGVVFACLFNEHELLTTLFMLTAVPLFINNYKVLMRIEGKTDLKPSKH